MCIRDRYLRAVVDVVIEVKDSVGRSVSNQNISVYRDFVIIEVLAVSHAITHKHRDTVEFQALNLDTGVAQVMHIVIKAIDISSIEAIVMVAADEYFVFIWQVTKPVEKINCFLFCPYHTEVAGMYDHIGLGQIPEPMVAVVSIREVEYFQVCKI